MKRFPYLALLLIATLASCGGGGSSSSGGSGFLTLEVTDAPIDPSIVEEARLAVTKITVRGDYNDDFEDDDDDGFDDDDDGFYAGLDDDDDDGDDGPDDDDDGDDDDGDDDDDDGDGSSSVKTIYEGPPLDFNLFELRNGVTRSLVLARLGTGSYDQVRLYVSSAYLRLTNGNEYSTEDGTLELPGQPAGTKVNIEPPLEITDGISRTLVLDFDLSRTFRPVPADDPLAATLYQLHPVIRASNVSNSGEIRGLVTRDDGDGGSEPVETAIVRIFHPGETDEDLAVATTLTEENGFYAFIGLRPGAYDVRASNEGLEGSVEGVEVSVGSAVLADIFIE